VLKNSKKNNYESNNNMSLEFDIQRYLDVNLTSSFDDNYYFDIKDALPITLNVESFIFIKTNCKHNIHHIFKLPVKTEIKWKIKGGTDNGAFKIGSGMDAEYFPRDYGDSVIFYPQLKNISKETTYKNIPIYLTINQLGSTLFEQQEYKFVVNVNILITRKFLKTNYRVKMFVIKLDNNDDDDKGHYDEKSNNKVDDNDYAYSSNILNSNIPSNDELKSITKVEQDGNLILFKSFNSCKICNLMVIDKFNKTSSFIKFFKKHLITTEIIKISAECNNNNTAGKKSNNNYYNNNNNGSVLFTGTNYKKYFLDGVDIEPKLFWESNSGKLVYGNLGQSLIYYTPGESELSKSPLTLNLYFQYDHSLEDFQQENLLDSKKFWILRQPPLMGG
jgi:disulfide oxidoreductase YuzD